MLYGIVTSEPIDEFMLASKERLSGLSFLFSESDIIIKEGFYVLYFKPHALDKLIIFFLLMVIAGAVLWLPLVIMGAVGAVLCLAFITPLFSFLMLRLGLRKYRKGLKVKFLDAGTVARYLLYGAD